MNKNILMASAITAGAAALFLILRNKRAGEAVKKIIAEQSRHLTNAFSKAKQLKVDA